jgi:hypothetical protein
MNAGQMGLIALIAMTMSAMQATQAQTLPTPEDFDRALKSCAIAQAIKLDASAIDSISKLYASEASRAVLNSSTEFVLLIPENMRLEAYRLYTDCIVKIAPQLATNSPPQPTGTATYKVCSGEYERACPPHDAYLYCYVSIEDWARARCTSYKIQRLNTYGGNRCGYSLDAVFCSGPK